MEEILNLIKNCNQEEINLNFKRINELDPLITHLNNKPHIKSINLSNNRIKKISSKVKDLKYIETIDLSGNLIVINNDNLYNLNHIYTLKNLFITLNGKEDLDLIKEILPNLKKLNDWELKSNYQNSINLTESEENESNEEIYEEDLEIIEDENFNQYSYKIFKFFKSFIQNCNINQHSKAILWEGIKNHIEKICRENENIMKKYEIQNKKKLDFKIKFGLIFFLYESINKILQLTQNNYISKGLNYISLNLNYLFNNIINNFDESIKENTFFNILKENHTNITTNKSSLKDKYDNLIIENKELIKRLEYESIKFKNEKEDLIFEKESLEIENKQLLNKLININKKAVENINIKPKEVQINNFKSLDSNNSNYDNFNSNNKKHNLKSTKKLIKSILKEKSYEWENKNNDTMEEFLFKFLNNKYGLKNLIIENGNNIIDILKNYNNKYVELKLIGKMLRNEIDYSFLPVFYKIKNQFEQNIRNELKINDIKNTLIPINKISTIIKFNINTKNDFNDFVLRIKKYIDIDKISSKILYFQLMDFNISKYENKIRFTVNKFKLIDIDNTGFVLKSQLKNMINNYSLKNKKIENKISFNQFIMLFN